jgi:hypothetical protein
VLGHLARLDGVDPLGAGLRREQRQDAAAGADVDDDFVPEVGLRVFFFELRASERVFFFVFRFSSFFLLSIFLHPFKKLYSRNFRGSRPSRFPSARSPGAYFAGAGACRSLFLLWVFRFVFLVE